MKARSMLGLALMLCIASASAQMFKWVDEKGVVHFSDQPPPPGEHRKVDVKPGAGSAGGVALPYVLSEAMRSAPVTLYTTRDCAACDQGRALLQARGIPFAEKTVTSNDDIARLAQAGSNGQLPLLVVGRASRTGFESTGWDAALTDAGYPLQSLLPANYRQAAAEPAAPPRPLSPEAAARAAARAQAAEAAEAARRQAPPPPPPSDFRF